MNLHLKDFVLLPKCIFSENEFLSRRKDFILIQEGLGKNTLGSNIVSYAEPPKEEKIGVCTE